MNNTNLKGVNRPFDIRKVPAERKKWAESDYIADAVGDRSLRAAAEWLNEALPGIFHRSHSSIASYINDGVQPDDVFLFALIEYYPETDPRHELAADLLASRQRAKAKA